MDSSTRRLQRGMTLLELLVAMVLTSFLVALLAQLLSQAMRIEQALSEGRYSEGIQALRMRWLTESIRAMQPSPLDATQVLSANERQLRFETLASPLAPQGGAGVLEAYFAYDARSDSTGLYLRDVAAERDEGAHRSIQLLSWPGRAGSLKYLDHLGGVHGDWNPKSSNSLRMQPSLVVVETGLRGWEKTIIQVDASPIAPVSRRQVDSL